MGSYCHKDMPEMALPDQPDKNGFINQCWALLQQHEQLSFVQTYEQGQILSQLRNTTYNRQKISIVSLGEEANRWIMLKNDAFMYLGEFSNSSMQGRGAVALPNNKIFIGEFSNSRVEGQGQLHFYTTDTSSPKTIKLCGKWNNQMVGQLTISGQSLPFSVKLKEQEGCSYIRYPNFDEYMGGTTNGLAEGEGRYTYRNGIREREFPVYQGCFRNGLRQGRGVMHYNCSMILRIHWVAGRPQGSGVLIVDNIRHSVIYRGGRRVQLLVSEVDGDD